MGSRGRVGLLPLAVLLLELEPQVVMRRRDHCASTSSSSSRRP